MACALMSEEPPIVTLAGVVVAWIAILWIVLG
jgi:hypothetical protein